MAELLQRPGHQQDAGDQDHDESCCAVRTIVALSGPSPSKKGRRKGGPSWVLECCD